MTRGERPTRSLVLGLLLLSFGIPSAGCGNELGPRTSSPFDRDELLLCEPGTSALGAFTERGGRLRIEVVGGCAPSTPCVGEDVYAPGSWATVRVSGRDLSVAGCPLTSALGGSALDVIFESDDAEPERHELPLRGACLDAGALGCVRGDGGFDAGLVTTGDGGDAGDAGDAGSSLGRRDAASDGAR